MPLRIRGRGPARRFLSACCVAGAAVIHVLGFSGPAFAEVLAWDGSLSFQFFDPNLGRPTLTGSGVAIALPIGEGPALETLRIRGGITDSTLVLVTDPEAVPLVGVGLTGTLGIGTLRPFQPPVPFGPQLTASTLALGGRARLCILYADCTSFLPIPFLKNKGATAVGVGGVLTGGGFGAIRISLQAAPWTVGTATIPLVTSGGSTVTAFAFGFARGPLSFTGSTATSGGEIQIVTPMVVQSTEGLSSLTGFGVLSIRFIPEPGFLLLLASGIGGLIALCRSRARP